MWKSLQGTPSTSFFHSHFWVFVSLIVTPLGHNVWNSWRRFSNTGQQWFQSVDPIKCDWNCRGSKFRNVLDLTVWIGGKTWVFSSADAIEMLGVKLVQTHKSLVTSFLLEIANAFYGGWKLLLFLCFLLGYGWHPFCDVWCPGTTHLVPQIHTSDSLPVLSKNVFRTVERPRQGSDCGPGLSLWDLLCIPKISLHRDCFSRHGRSVAVVGFSKCVLWGDPNERVYTSDKAR